MIAAVLETMWGEAGRAPGWFRINPRNFTGRRLHYLTGQDTVWVTNACPQQVGKATQHGVPNPKWLAANLLRASKEFKRLAGHCGLEPIDLLLVCGRVAKETYIACAQHLPADFRASFMVMFMPHPAARSWTRKDLRWWRNKIAGFRS